MWIGIVDAGKLWNSHANGEHEFRAETREEVEAAVARLVERVEGSNDTFVHNVTIREQG